MRRAGAVAAGVLTMIAALACSGAPPQIVDYSPERGAKDVSTAAPIQITFDHDVDQGSVASRLHLDPATQGTIRWLSGRRLTYEHATLAPDTIYEVILEAGYRDLEGNVYGLRHHWAFTTEPPPAFAGSNPADGATGVDPADYLAITFSRAMNAGSMKSAITFSPSTAFNVRMDPADARIAIVAPDSLLDPKTGYQLLVTTSATDVDGNPLARVATIGFTTGPVRPLHHWVAFATQGVGSAAGGLWIVNPDTGFPRRLLSLSGLTSFSWSPEGDRIVLQGGGGTWSAFTPGQGSESLGFQATWAAALAAGLGYAFLEPDGSLHRITPDGVSSVIATSAASAAVSPDGRRIAFVQLQGDTSTVWGYDVGLKSRYLLGTETGAVSRLSWSPAANRIAYLRTDDKGTSLRVRSLTGTASTSTVATGDLVGPAVWLRDSDHIVFAATVKGTAALVSKAFLINVVAPPSALNESLGLPADPSVPITDVSDPVPSPDGHQIAFLSGNQLWIMNADGTRPTALTTFDPESFPYSCRMPAWTRS